MIFGRGFGGLVLALVVGASIVLSGCGGGGGGGDDGGGNEHVVVRIQAGQTLLWQNVPGNPTPGLCPNGVAMNQAITFTFDGPVDPTSIPDTGVATGSINIFINTTGNPNSGQAAIGNFHVEDDPSAPLGNQRRVVFTPAPPASPNAQCAAGLSSAEPYRIVIPSTGGGSPQVLRISGVPISNSAIACFNTCGCPVPGVCSASFTDPIPGPPYVVVTTPTTNDPPPPPISPATVVGNQIRILISEALNPAGVTIENVRIVNTLSGAQVPGTLEFHQTGSEPSLSVQSRIDYNAAEPLLNNTTYEILFDPAVVDFGGNQLANSLINPTLRLLFQTTSVPFCEAPIMSEGFETTDFRDTLVGSIRWDGNGLLQAVYPTDLIGDGSDGDFTPAAGPNPIVLDTEELVSGVPRKGIWNFGDVVIPNGATVRIIGDYQAHFRCTGTVFLDGVIDVSAGVSLLATPDYERGPESGVQNNGAPATNNCEAIGGWANAGGGRGGTGSGPTPPGAATGTTGNCTTRTQSGEPGYGATIDGAWNPGGVNDFYGGGLGGDSGCNPFLATNPVCVTGDIGGLGGAGGASAREGEDGVPRIPTGACGPNPTVAQPIATRGTVPVAMIAPVIVQCGGSGGGGGGDELELAGALPTNDEQGGGGGGGGGSFRITSVGDFWMGVIGPGGQIRALGATGATAQTFGGAGGSGGGGQIWVQTFGTITITPASTMNVDGPARVLPTIPNIGCTNQASGGGGDGMIQLEPGTGPLPPPSFNIVPPLPPTPDDPPTALFVAVPFPHAGGVVGIATSDFRHAGYAAPLYQAVFQNVNLGDAPGATCEVRFEGAHAAVGSLPGSPVADPASIKSQASGGGPITAANISELNGYAFIRFVVTVTFPPPPTTPPTAILPSVDAIHIVFTAPCP